MAGEGFWRLNTPDALTDGVALTVDDAAGFVVTASSVWGVDGDGRPYHDPAGAAAGEDAKFHAASRPYLST